MAYLLNIMRKYQIWRINKIFTIALSSSRTRLAEFQLWEFLWSFGPVRLPTRWVKGWCLLARVSYRYYLGVEDKLTLSRCS